MHEDFGLLKHTKILMQHMHVHMMHHAYTHIHTHTHTDKHMHIGIGWFLSVRHVVDSFT